MDIFGCYRISSHFFCFIKLTVQTILRLPCFKLIPMLIILAASSEKCLRACAKCAESHHLQMRKVLFGLCSPFIHSVVSSYFISGQ